MGKYDMTKPYAIALLDRIKNTVDNTVKAALDADLSEVVTYKKVGGMHHWKLGRLGGSVYLKKPIKPAKPATVDEAITRPDYGQEAITESELAAAYLKHRIERFINK